jgi:N-acetylmuramoyl-L-alanine amidase
MARFWKLFLPFAALLLVTVLVMNPWSKTPEPPAYTPTSLPPERLTIRPGISDLAEKPLPSELAPYQNTITRDAFLAELENVYSEGDAWKNTIKISDTQAEIQTPERDKPFVLNFADKNAPPERYWRSVDELPVMLDWKNKPLQGVRIAIDPGHIGGDYAQVEERWYKMRGSSTQVMEGELTLETAKLLKGFLEKVGATVTLVRSTNAPVTPRRPEDFRGLAAEQLRRQGIDPDNPKNRIMQSVQWNSEKYFYRYDEIRERAHFVNKKIKPDLTLCLHYNAEAWGNPARPSFVPRNHMHLLINGTYSRGELSLHDQRFEMLHRLLQRVHPEELALSESVAIWMAKETGLPPFRYVTSNAKEQGLTTYVYSRNLLANRIYQCPVVFLEPYVMNNSEVYTRVGLGAYEGRKNIRGKQKLSIFHEYAVGVARGLVDYYRKNRKRL